MDLHDIGGRVRRLRLINELDQTSFGHAVGLNQTAVSNIENGRTTITAGLAAELAAALGCTTDFLTSEREPVITTRPWLRAYADASQHVVDRQIADCTTAMEFADRAALPRLPASMPIFDGDPTDDDAIESFANEVRVAAQISEGSVVRNMTRAAERLGCVVLPMTTELGRHVGLSTLADLTPMICVSRPSHDPKRHVPGDRQRFTIAHEVAHLTLHRGQPAPRDAEAAAQIEKQAHRFAGAFLAPADAIVDELAGAGGRVTLRTLNEIKIIWGVAIKALVVRFRQLGVINDDNARSLYKQISARGWNKAEPVPVDNEAAVWMDKAIARRVGDSTRAAAQIGGIDESHIRRWTDWSPTGVEVEAGVIDLATRRGRRRGPLIPER